MLKSFKDLQILQKSYTLSLDIYEATSNFPASEVYGLTAQIRRAAVSIPSNIAEGYSRGHTAEYVRFVNLAYGSLAELQTQLMLARDLGYLEQSVYEKIASQYEDLEHMLSALMRGLKGKESH